jgi:hypothetical protein
MEHFGIRVHAAIGAPGEFFVVFALILLAVLSLFSGASRMGLLFAVVAAGSGTFVHFFG